MAGGGGISTVESVLSTRPWAGLFYKILDGGAIAGEGEEGGGHTWP